MARGMRQSVETVRDGFHETGPAVARRASDEWPCNHLANGSGDDREFAGLNIWPALCPEALPLLMGSETLDFARPGNHREEALYLSGQGRHKDRVMACLMLP